MALQNAPILTLQVPRICLIDFLVEHRYPHTQFIQRMTRVNSTNVLNEGLRIGEIGRQMNSKVKLVEIGMYRK
jgi:hypothetical protein